MRQKWKMEGTQNTKKIKRNNKKKLVINKRANKTVSKKEHKNIYLNPFSLFDIFFMMR